MAATNSAFGSTAKLSHSRFAAILHGIIVGACLALGVAFLASRWSVPPPPEIPTATQPKAAAPVPG